MINYFGIATRKDIELFTGEVVEFFDGPVRDGDDVNQKFITVFQMMMRIYATETQMGTFKDTDPYQGFGLSQIDRIKYKDIIFNSQEHRDAIWNKWYVDMNLVTIEAMRYGWQQSIIFTRLGLKRIPEPIPDDFIGQAYYWLEKWNVCGKGSIDHFITSCNIWGLGE